MVMIYLAYMESQNLCAILCTFWIWNKIKLDECLSGNWDSSNLYFMLVVTVWTHPTEEGGQLHILKWDDNIYRANVV